MPDLYTHKYFILDLVQTLGGDVQALYQEYPGLLLFGAQGPDPFFYYNFLPGKPKKGIPHFGAILHEEKTAELLTTMAELLRNSEAKKKKQSRALFYGFLSHFSLDTTLHPYIFYRTGEYREEDPQTHRHRGNHLRYERSVDSLLIQKTLGKPAHQVRLDREVLFMRSLPQEVEDFMEAALYSIYTTPGMGKVYGLSYRHMRTFFRHVAYDPLGFRKTLYRILDRTVNRHGSLLYANLSYYKNIEKGIDYFNEAKRPWCHPCDKEEAHEESVHELYALALQRGEDLLKQTEAYLLKDGPLPSYPNLSYSTGRNCNEGLQLLYCDPLYEP